MDISLNGKKVHASTGGVAFDAAKPVVVFLHGAGMDHTVWFLQSRWFAYRGRAVLALDFPGHGGSDGPLLSSIEDMADWVAAVLDQLATPHTPRLGALDGAVPAGFRQRALAADGLGPGYVVDLIGEEQTGHGAGAVDATAVLTPRGVLGCVE